MEHYYSEKQTSPYKPFKISIRLKSDEFELYSSYGLFSKKALDKASKLLIESIEVNKSSTLLDLGCGYGVVGIAILRKYPSVNMTFSDVNERALKITQKNLDLLGLKAKVIKSYLFNGTTKKFDYIITNPPYAAGRDLCFSLIENSLQNLKKGGTLWLVARHNKGGKILKEKMLEVFGNADENAKSAGFRVYISKKK